MFGDLARMTLAGWDEKASLAAASDPKTAREVLDYLVSPENLRPKLLPALLENPSVPESELAKFAISASPENIATMLQSERVLKASEYFGVACDRTLTVKANEASTFAELLGGETSAAVTTAESPVTAAPDSDSPLCRAETDAVRLRAEEEPDDVPEEAISAYLSGARGGNCCGRRKAISADRRNHGFAGSGLFSGLGGAGDSAGRRRPRRFHGAASAAAAKPGVAAAAKPSGRAVPQAMWRQSVTIRCRKSTGST